MILLLSTLGHAATLAVDTTGASGTYGSISAAILAAADGDTITVAAGTWYDCVDFDGKDLAIVGAGSATTTLDGAGVCAVLITATGGETASLSGFSASNNGKNGIVGRRASRSRTWSSPTWARRPTAAASP